MFSVSPYTGEVLGKASAGGPVTVPTAVADGTVYLPDRRGRADRIQVMA